MDILSEIIANKRREIETPGYFQTLDPSVAREAAHLRGSDRRERQNVLENMPHIGPACTACDGKTAKQPVSNFVAALKSAPIGLIAEVKRKSPSAGPIREPFDPAAIARAYEKAGAQAISCLMDSKYFGGGEAQWNAVRAAARLPMLYKEFVIDPRQIFHAEALGASAVLLIVAALDTAELEKFIRLIEASGMTALVEVHAEEEMTRAVAVGATCIGINNRNLKTFETKLEITLKLRELAPKGCTLISESGIRTAADVQLLRDAGIAAILVGESLLRQPDLEMAVRNLMGK